MTGHDDDDVTEPKDDRSEFEKFEKLARNLVKIPKREIDEQREKEQSEKDR